MNKKIVDIFISFVMFAFGVWIIVLSESIRLGSVVGVVGPKFFPQLLSTIIIFMSVLLGISTLITWKKDTSAPVSKSDVIDQKSRSILKKPSVRVITMLLLVSGYLFLLDLLGYRISSLIFISLLLIFKGMRSPLWVGITSVALVMVLYGLFFVLLSIPLPVGTLTDLR